MTRRVIVVAYAEADLDQLSEAERTAVTDDLWSWVEDGPPRLRRRTVGGAQAFDDQLPSGFAVVYFADEAQRYVAVLRIRRGPPLVADR